MADATRSGHFGLGADRTAPVTGRAMAPFKALARRLADVLEKRRQRDIDAVIVPLLIQSGGRLTDSLEREITRKALGAGWSRPL